MLRLLLLVLLLAAPTLAQDHYFPQLLPIRAETGLPPFPGVYYSNVNAFMPMEGTLSRNVLRDRVGADLTISAPCYANMNLFVWQTGEKFLGADYGAAVVWPTAIQATPAARLEVGRFLARDASTNAFGLFDLYVSPLMLTWRGENHQICFNYGFWAPTGGTTGLGYWEHQLQLGSTVFVDEEHTWSLSALGTLELNAPSIRRDYTKGNYFTVEWGVVKNLDPNITLGLVGYDTFQISNDSGPAVGRLYNPVRDYQHAIGGELTWTIPEANYLSIGIKHLRDISSYGRLGFNTTSLSFSVPIDMELPEMPPAPAPPAASPGDVPPADKAPPAAPAATPAPQEKPAP